MEKVTFIKGKSFDQLPKTSGVYFFFARKSLGEGGLRKPIYIGKAINIKNRVKNHFSQPSYRDNLYIDKVDKIGFIDTNSEIEALILEASLIKKHQPKYNVIWKDDKNYFYVAIVASSAKASAAKAKIPYIYITHQPQKDRCPTPIFLGPFVEGTPLKKTLRFLRRVFPYYTSARHPKNKCTYCHLDLCPGPNPDLKEYKKNIKKLVLILQGKRSAVLKSLRKEMSRYARSGIARKDDPEDKNFEKAAEIRDRIFALQQIMAHTHVIENNAFLPAGKNASSNIEILQKIIGTPKPVSRIECYDISNIQGKHATGSMVVFADGQPAKSQYKKFKIKLLDTPNDIAMLKEVLERRFAHGEWQYPDAILIDGGIAQLNVAIHAKDLNLKTRPIKVISIAKGKQELYIEGREKPIPLKLLPREVYNIIKQLDDEAHRFAITYHKKLRKKNLLQ